MNENSWEYLTTPFKHGIEHRDSNLYIPHKRSQHFIISNEELPFQYQYELKMTPKSYNGIHQTQQTRGGNYAQFI